MQLLSKGFFFTLTFSLLLALFVMYVLLVHKGVKQTRRRLYLVSFSILWMFFVEFCVF